MTRVVSLREVEEHPSSGADSNGFLFEFEGELYRAVSGHGRGVVEQLLDDGTIGSLCDRLLLVPTRRADLLIEGYPLVVWHEKLPIVSYPGEWSFGMLKEAALLLVDFEEALVPLDLSVHDAHPWNVLYRWTRPLMVDLGAIMPAADTSLWSGADRHPLWPAYYQFRTTFFNPLRMMSWGQTRIARALLRDYLGASDSEADRMSPVWRARLRLAAGDLRRQAARHVRAGVRKTFPPLVLRLGRRFVRALRREVPQAVQPLLPERAQRLKFLAAVKASLNDLSFGPVLGGGTSYIGGDQDRTRYYEELHGGEVPDLASTAGWTVKNHVVASLLDRCQPRFVLDIGCSTGWFSRLAARRGAAVVACDSDEGCVEDLFLTCKREGSPILPLLIDFRSPTPGVGPTNRWLRPATERLRADLVLMLALVHHLVFKQSMTFQQIVETLRLTSRRWAICEFIPRTDTWVRDVFGPRFSWYTLDGFLDCLRGAFDKLECFPSFPEGRTLIFCERS